MSDIVNMPDDEPSLFVGKRAEYYLSKWREFPDEGAPASLNLAALFLGLLWFSYRKMYLYAFSILGIAIVFTEITTALKLPDIIDGSITMSFQIIPAVFANYLYRRHAGKKISMLKLKYQDEDRLKAEMTRVGGTSLLGVLSFIVALFLIVVVWASIESVLKGS